MTAAGQLTFLSMFMLGLFGTGHCLGMCGPLVVALPGRWGSWRAHLAYHAGRILTYTLIGALMGGAGSGFAGAAAPLSNPPLGGMVRLQLLMSALAAVFLLVFGLNRIGILPEPPWLSAINPERIPGLSRRMGKALQANRIQFLSLFSLGLMLGLLPCGLSYAAFARALASGSMLNGGFLVLGFALGTLPGLLALGSGAGRVFRRFRRQADILAGLIMIAMALMLIKDFGTAF